MQWSNSSLLKHETVKNLDTEKSILTEAVIKTPSPLLSTTDSTEAGSSATGTCVET